MLRTCFLLFFVFFIAGVSAHEDTLLKNNSVSAEDKIKYIESHENEHHEQIQSQQHIIAGGIIGGLIILLLAASLYRQVLQKKKANLLLSEKNKEITDSINYASRIQQAILPSEEKFKSLLPESFILYKPKDIVSGDFYWILEKDDKIFFAAVDCTGHGVPGAFMSIIACNLLNHILKNHKDIKTNEVLDKLHISIHEHLNQHSTGGNIDLETIYQKIKPPVRDSMDISLCSYSKNDRMLEFSGAFSSAYYVSNGTLSELKGEKVHLGDLYENVTPDFSSQTIQLKKGDTLYLFSDGYADQFGGAEGKKFRYKQFREIILNIQNKSIFHQKKMLDDIIEKWRGELDQVDDILVMGIKFN